MITSFSHKGLAELFNDGKTKHIGTELVKRVTKRLNVLRDAATLEELNVPGFNFHPLHGVPQRYSIHVNGPWCITFEWENGEALRVNLEQYH